MTRYSAAVAGPTPQTEKAVHGQVKNSSSGFVFQITKWQQLDRFLVLGSEKTFYATERKLTRENATCLTACLAEDGQRVIQRIVEVSDSGRAPKNDPAIFALAMAAGDKSPAVRAAALAALPKVCRIGTHLFHFAEDVTKFRRWGRSLRRAVSHWYLDRSVDSLALQAIKYQQRDGWSHKDLLRLSHASTLDQARNATFRWITSGLSGLEVANAKAKAVDIAKLPMIIHGFEEIHDPTTAMDRSIALIKEFGLPHECVPNELKGKPEVWEAMLDSMGITAIVRNLGKMTSIGLIKPLSKASRLVTSRLRDGDLLKKGRVHPISLLMAMKIYAQGHGDKGSLTWTPVREVLDALDEAFYASFANVKPTGKRILLALDVSGSMASGGFNSSALTPREITGAMAMVTARTEPNWACVGFSNGIKELPISPKQRLEDIIRSISNLPFENTNCALPMIWAAQNKLEFDATVIWTDNETNSGALHPFQALEKYRSHMGIPAKLAVCATTATDFSIANPNDAGMLDLVGFSADVPNVLSDFIAMDIGGA